MYTIMFLFTDKTYYEFEHAIRVEYNQYGDVVVTGDEILSHKFPTDRNLYVFSENKSYTTAGKRISSMEITKES